MAADIKQTIKKGQIIVLIIPNEQYAKKIVEITKYFADNHKATCYVSLNKLFNSLTKSLDNAKINQNKFLFIDAITKQANPNIKAAGLMNKASSLVQEGEYQPALVLLDEALKYCTGNYHAVVLFNYNAVAEIILGGQPEVQFGTPDQIWDE